MPGGLGMQESTAVDHGSLLQSGTHLSFQTPPCCGTVSRRFHAFDRRSPLGKCAGDLRSCPGVVARPRHRAHAARGVLGDHATELLLLPIRTIHESPAYPSSKERFSEMMV